MKTKRLVYALPALILIAIHLAQAQQPEKAPRLGWLASASPTPALSEAFRQGLRELGYVEGKNIVIEQRRAERTDQLPPHAAELVGLKVDVIFASGGSQSVLAAKSATTTIPIVMSNLEGKRLELLKESFPTYGSVRGRSAMTSLPRLRRWRVASGSR